MTAVCPDGVYVTRSGADEWGFAGRFDDFLCGHPALPGPSWINKPAEQPDQGSEPKLAA